jgi:hypothetical protein
MTVTLRSGMDPEPATGLPMASLGVDTRRVELVAVSGLLEGAGFAEWRQRLDATLQLDIRRLLMDRVLGCQPALFALLAEVYQVLAHRIGWLWLIDLSAPVLDALESAEAGQVALISRISARPPAQLFGTRSKCR